MTTAVNPTPITAQPAIVAPKRFNITKNLVVGTAAYSAGYCVGGLINTTNVPSSGKLQNVCVNMASGSFASSLDMVIFSSPPTGTYADSTALSLTSHDIGICLGSIHLASNVSVGGAGVLCQAQEVSFDYQLTGNAGGNTTLSTLLIARGSVTFSTTSDVTMNVQCEN
jgi:hypothetical protein